MPVPLRRGFKAEAEAYAIEFRMELGILPTAPLDMFLLAVLLEVPTLPLSALSGEIQPVNYALLTSRSGNPLSAVTLFTGRRRAIVFNDSNAPTRQQSDVAHELSHAILDHPPSELTDASGGRHYNEVLEAEAICLSGVLLVPRPAAIRLATAKTALEIAAAHYNISPAMMRMRLNQSGAMKIAARSAGR
jgi:Zn-dependent peptidase ImmA (M78 family)